MDSPLKTYECIYCKKKAKCKFCSRCKIASYCSRECQVAHWPTHKDQCQETAPVITKLHKRLQSIFLHSDLTTEHKRIKLLDLFMNRAGYIRHFHFDTPDSEFEMNTYSDIDNLCTYEYSAKIPFERGYFVSVGDQKYYYRITNDDWNLYNNILDDTAQQFASTTGNGDIVLESNIYARFMDDIFGRSFSSKDELTKVALHMINKRVHLEGKSKREKYTNLIRKMLIVQQGCIYGDQEKKLKRYLRDGKRASIEPPYFFYFTLSDDFADLFE